MVSLFVSGCASNPSMRPTVQSPSALPSDTEIVWANKISERRDQHANNGKPAKFPSNKEILLAMKILNYGSPTPEEIAWACKIIELHDQQEEYTKQMAEFAKQRQINYKQMVNLANQQNELQEVEDAIEIIKKEARADNQLIDWLTKNKEQVKADANKTWSPTKQERFESYGFKGDVLDYWVDDVTIEGKSVLAYSEVYWWKKSDGGVGITRIKLGYDLQNKMFAGHKFISTKEFTDSELMAIGNVNPKQDNRQVIASFPTGPEPSKWTPNNETLNKLYGAGIDIATFFIEKKLDQWMQK